MVSGNIPRIIAFNIDWVRIRQEASKLVGVFNEVAKAYSEAEKKKKPGKRKYFSASIKKKILAKQNYKCKICHRFLDVYDFDHVDENSSNNRMSNCQAVHPDCHAKKTRKKSF